MNATDDSGKEATGAERSERHREREGADEEHNGQQKDVGHGAGDVRVVARLSGEVPAELQTPLLADTVRTHLDALLVRQTVLVQIAQQVDAEHTQCRTVQSIETAVEFPRPLKNMNIPLNYQL